MQMPVYIGLTPRELWLLPYEPLVSVRGRAVITRRTVAKLRDQRFGSVKELWTKDDYEITLRGRLHNHENPDQLPADMISRLDGLCSARKPLLIQCELLEVLGCTQVAIESWEFPETPGIGNVNYVIRGFSDNHFNLFIER